MPDTSLQPVSEREAVTLSYPKRPLRKRLASAFRSWARSTLSRESLVGSLKSLMWVVPLTALIWIYAEREQMVTLTNVAFNVDIRTGDPNRTVRLLSPVGSTVHAELRGPQAGIDHIKELLETGSVPLEIDPNTSAGDHQISTDLLNQQQEFKHSGVTVSNCVPADLQFHVDTIESRWLEVQARPQDLQKFNPPVFTPAKIKFTAPTSFFERNDGPGRPLVAYADFSLFAELSEVGSHTLTSVPIAPSVRIDDPHAKLSPTTVSAQVQVKPPATQELELPYVRVLAAYPNDEDAKKYAAVFQNLRNVKVIGPPDQIELLKSQKFIPAAFFEVNVTDVKEPNVDISAEIRTWYLPPGVRASPEDASRKITYHLQAHDAAG